ncbi:hypothetical protein LPJ66_005658 [Kickxella alabastrina]|uniref:Uncharacterized protein n=1 Tax=Kickxella alabastrina TaxID=61397 RepID=A0ACC1IG72_9FUNG|nr:hypothetical protein LPJ66_005658 [Kickxella alabastrina]
MLRGFVITLVIVLLVLQALSSLFETGIYAGVQVFLDKNDLAYTKGWQYYFKWVVKPLSAVTALGLLISSMCSCCCGGPKRSADIRGGRTFPSVLGFFSLVLTALWAVVVAFQVRDTNATTVETIFNSSFVNQAFIYPLGKGFSLKNDCKASPFTLMEHGETACTLLKAETALTVVCLALWALTFIFSTLLCCIVRRTRRVNHATADFNAYSPTTPQFKH